MTGRPVLEKILGQPQGGSLELTLSQPPTFGRPEPPYPERLGTAWSQLNPSDAAYQIP